MSDAYTRSNTAVRSSVDDDMSVIRSQYAECVFTLIGVFFLSFFLFWVTDKTQKFEAAVLDRSKNDKKAISFEALLKLQGRFRESNGCETFSALFSLLGNLSILCRENTLPSLARVWTLSFLKENKDRLFYLISFKNNLTDSFGLFSFLSDVLPQKPSSFCLIFT